MGKAIPLANKKLFVKKENFSELDGETISTSPNQFIL